VNVKTASRTLIHQSRVREAVADYDVAALERRPYYPIHELGSRGVHDQRLSARSNLEIVSKQHQLAQLIAKRRSARLVRCDYGDAPTA
jgi:hypothetical protein